MRGAARQAVLKVDTPVRFPRGGDAQNGTLVASPDQTRIAFYILLRHWKMRDLTLPGARGPRLCRAIKLPGMLLFAALLHIGAGQSQAASAADEWAAALSQVETGVFVHYGRHDEITLESDGDIANIGFIIGEKCVAVIDTGGSVSTGRKLREAIRRHTPLPVCYVINTHFHPDHVFGNAAFIQDAPDFIAHKNFLPGLRNREVQYLRHHANNLGKDAAKEIRILPPTREVASSMTIDLGGRVLELRAWPTAHTNADLTVHDRKTGTLWLGDLLFEKRVPSLDGSLKGWLAAMETLRRVEAKRVVPGHGASSTDWPGAADRQTAYLSSLLREVRQAIRERKSLGDTLKSARAQGADWALFDQYHVRNMTAAYAELEWEE